MYYEEQLVGGILCWRSAPTDEWKPLTLEELSGRCVRLQKELAIALSTSEPKPPGHVCGIPDDRDTCPNCEPGRARVALTDGGREEG